MTASLGRRPTRVATFLVAAGLLARIGTPAARAADACASESFAIPGSPGVRIVLCPSPGKAGDATSQAFTETLTSGDATFTRETVLKFFEGASSSRSIDDVPLARVGIDKTLHLTILSRDGAIRIEHALLVPGAVLLK